MRSNPSPSPTPKFARRRRPRSSTISAAARCDARSTPATIHAALEAVARIARQPERRARCGGCSRASKCALSSSMFGVVAVTPLSSPPITPPMATARCASAMTSCCGVEPVGAPIEREEFLALPRHAHADVAVELVGIEGVQRLAEFEHHVIGDVHDVVDRAQADRFELAPQPLRARPDLHVGDLERRCRAGIPPAPRPPRWPTKPSTLAGARRQPQFAVRSAPRSRARCRRG